MSETFLYSVHPCRVITGIEGVGTIRTAKSVYLTKEDVYKCLQKAHVYRRFENAYDERVTTSNVERVHRKEYISEKDWPAFLAAEKSKGAGTVKEPEKFETVVEPVKVEEVKPEPVEEVKVEEPVVEEVVEETTVPEVEVVEEVIEEEEVVLSDDEDPSETIAVETAEA